MPPKTARKTGLGSAQKGKVRKTTAAPAADGDGTPTKARKTKGGKQSKVNANVQRTFYPPPTTSKMSALHYSPCAIPYKLNPSILTIPQPETQPPQAGAGATSPAPSH